MKKVNLFTPFGIFLFLGLETTAQEYPVISEAQRITRLNAPEGKVHMVLDTDQHTFSVDESRHLIRAAYFINRDAIFGDFFHKIEAAGKNNE